MFGYLLIILYWLIFSMNVLITILGICGIYNNTPY